MTPNGQRWPANATGATSRRGRGPAVRICRVAAQGIGCHIALQFAHDLCLCAVCNGNRSWARSFHGSSGICPWCRGRITSRFLLEGKENAIMDVWRRTGGETFMDVEWALRFHLLDRHGICLCLNKQSIHMSNLWLIFHLTGKCTCFKGQISMWDVQHLCLWELVDLARASRCNAVGLNHFPGRITSSHSECDSLFFLSENGTELG